MLKSYSLLVFHPFAPHLAVNTSYFGDTEFFIYISPNIVMFAESHSSSNFTHVRSSSIASLAVYLNAQFQNISVTLFTMIFKLTHKFAKRQTHFTVPLREPYVLLCICTQDLNLMAAIPRMVFLLFYQKTTKPS